MRCGWTRFSEKVRNNAQLDVILDLHYGVWDYLYYSIFWLEHTKAVALGLGPPLCLFLRLDLAIMDEKVGVYDLQSVRR